MSTKSSMNILIIPSIDWVGGPENRLHRIARQWNKRIEVCVYCFPLTGDVKRTSQCTLLKPPTVYCNNVLSFYLLNMVPHALFIVQAILRGTFSVIVIAHPLYGVPTIIAAKIKRIPIVFDLQDDLVGLTRIYSPSCFSFIFPLIALFATSLIIRASNIVTAVSQSLGEFATRFNHRVIIVPNGVNSKLFTPKSSLFTSNRRVVGYVGSISSWSGVWQMLSKVVNKVLEFDHNVEFHIYGDGPEAPMIRQLSRNEQAIKYFGEISYEKVPDVLQTFTVGLIPFPKCSIADQSCPMKLFEYWASGVPVVSTNLEGVKHFGDNAVLLVNDYEEMAEEIKRLLSNESLRSRLISHGLSRVAKYQWSRISSKLLDVIFALDK